MFLSILLLEDDPEILSQLENMLNQMGHKVVSTKDRLTFVRELHTNIFDAAILDNHVPKYPNGEAESYIGVKMVRYITRRFPDMKLAMHTKCPPCEVIEALDLGAVYLTKPVSTEKLNEFLENS